MIKIDLLLPTDCAQARELLKHEPLLPGGAPFLPNDLSFRGLTFWQHWLPCNWHAFPSVYVAREDGTLIGLIAVSSMGKSKLCWRIDHLVIHPDHRGRGLALELLRYVFALFGGQGVNHFVACAADGNSAVLKLFNSCGFRRCTQVTVFEFPHGLNQDLGPVGQSSDLHLRRASSADAHGLFQLFQDVLPPDIRTIFAYTQDDFLVVDSRQVRSLKERVTGKLSWYWVSEDHQRQVITSAGKITCDKLGNPVVVIAVHPGWKHQGQEFVYACLRQLEIEVGLKGAKIQVFDFDTAVIEAVAATGGEVLGRFWLLAREHWVRARQSKLQRVSLPGLVKPAINFP